jgi:hypothetical protein
MCGIVGMVVKANTGLQKQHEDTFYQLLYADALRGEDSTGIIGVEKDTTFHIAKEAVTSSWFIPQLDAHKIGKDMWRDGKAYIGHNRKSTIGKTVDENAHPFTVNDEFAMVHNGTLFNHRELADTVVDSEALAIHLHKAFTEDNYKETLETALGKVNGAYAVAMYDQRKNHVRLLRNKDRPLSIVETPNAWYWASEAGLLIWILSRNGYDISKCPIKNVTEHTLLTFDLDKTTLTEEVLVPKKSTAPTKVMVGSKTKSTVVTFNPKSQEGLSKNSYKKFRRNLLGKKVEWWVEDFIETNYPKTIASGESDITLMGVCDSLLIDHMMVTEINLKDLNLIESELTDRLWTGTIHDMSYDPKTKKVSIELVAALPLPVSFRSNKSGIPVIDGEYIRKKLNEQEASSTTVH